MDSKFINPQTIEFLKKQQGSTVQQQLEALDRKIIKYGLDLDGDVEFQKGINSDLNIKINNLGKAILTIQESIGRDRNERSDMWECIEELETKSRKNFKVLTIVAVVLIAGVVLCLAKLLT